MALFRMRNKISHQQSMSSALPVSKGSSPQQPLWQQVAAPYSLGYRIRLLSQLMGRSLQQKLTPYGLTPFHWVVLCCLWEQDGLATSDIACRLQQVGGTMTGVISRMEERDLLYRKQDERDRRVWRIWLTETGRQIQSKLCDIAINNREQSLKGFSEQEQKQLSELIDKAIANLNESLTD
ncbi:MAG: MarR family transcriptional regulator [Phormidesmis sp.]